MQHIRDIASVCAGHGVTTAIISPGSRSAPLTLAFARHPRIETKVIPDERSAAFIGMSIAQQQGRPVVLICTSGSAAYNYAPAIAEAFYQEIPLLILTADRPPEWINQYDGQTIMQSHIYGKHVKKSFDFPTEVNSDDSEWYCNRMVNESLLVSMDLPKGPVHINIPFREPFYPQNGEVYNFPEVRIIENTKQRQTLSEEEWKSLRSQWNESSNRLVAIGQLENNFRLTNILDAFSKNTNTPVLADIIANHNEVEEAIVHQDIFLNGSLDEQNKALAPDLLITIGKSFISKNLKRFFRKHRPKTHWHVQPSARLNDSLQNVTKIIRMEPQDFFSTLEGSKSENGFANQWISLNNKTASLIDEALDQGDFSEFHAVKEVLAEIPNNSQVHLANSMAVRYVNFLGLKDKTGVSVFANRGTSGIDGSNSTAVGAALSNEKPVTLLTGDMAFFYDRNAFWHNYDLKNLRIVILNNHAGGIFRMIEGPSNQPELEEYFETQQKLNAENTCHDFGFAYYNAKSRDELRQHLKEFYNSSEEAKVLEIETDSAQNASFFKSFKHFITGNLTE